MAATDALSWLATGAVWVTDTTPDRRRRRPAAPTDGSDLVIEMDYSFPRMSIWIVSKVEEKYTVVLHPQLRPCLVPKNFAKLTL